jgi:hypothetical protein
MPKTTDERIDALTTSVELLASLYRDREKVLYDFMRTQRDSHKLLPANMQSQSAAITLMASSLDKLAQVAEAQELRLQRLEGHTDAGEGG